MTTEPENIGQQIAQALAVDPATTSTITITPEGGEFVTVTVEMQRTITIDDELGERIVTILGNYRLVPLESAPPPPPPPRCTSIATLIGQTISGHGIITPGDPNGPRCVLPQGHDGWHSDGAHPLPMQWIEHT